MDKAMPATGAPPPKAPGASPPSGAVHLVARREAGAPVPYLHRATSPLEQYAVAFLAWLQEVRRRSPRTVESYSYDLSRFLTFARLAGLTHPDEVRLYHLDTYVLVCAREYHLSQASTNRGVHCLRTFWRYLLKRDLAARDVPSLLELPKAPERIPVYLTEAEQAKLLSRLEASLIEGNLVDRRDYALVLTLLHTGVRVSELIGLRVDALDLKGRTLRVTGKGDKERIVPLSPRLTEALTEYLDEVRPWFLNGTDPGTVFLTGTSTLRYGVPRERPSRPGLLQDHSPGRPLSSRGVLTQIIRLCRQAGITKKVTVHMFRHTFASTLRQRGADLQLIQELLGHAKLDTTTIYAHIPGPKLRDQFNALMNDPPRRGKEAHDEPARL